MFLLAALLFLIPSTKGFAQSDCFQGPSGAKVIIDYQQGLAGDVNGDKVTLVNPFTMANREFLPLRDSLNNAQERLAFLTDRFNDALQLADSLQNVIETCNVAYSNACLTDLEQLDNLLEVYISMDDDIESRLATRSIRKTKQPSDVIYDLATFTTDLDYLMWHVNFCADYLVDLCDEIVESATNCSDDLEEAAERLDLWAFIIETLSNNCLTIANYYEENYYNFDYASLVELQEMIYEQATAISDLATEIKDNADMPIDMDFALKFIISTANSTAEEMNEAIGEWSDLVESYSNIAANFMPVLLGFAEDATTGMYLYLSSQDGVMKLPSEMTFGDNGGSVVEVDGNIFGGDYPDGFPALKSIVIPSSIESLKNQAFRVEGIESVSVEGNSVPELESDCFTDNVYASAVLYVNDSLKDAFKSHPSWSRFAKIESSLASVNCIDIADDNIKIVGMTLYVEVSSNQNVTVWNSNGLKISDNSNQVTLPARGVYIVKIGNKVAKVSC